MCPVTDDVTDWERLEALRGGSYGYDEEVDIQPGSSDYDDPKDYQEWCDWNDVEDEEGYYDPFQPELEGGFLLWSTASAYLIVLFSSVCNVVQVPSVKAFKQHLDKYWADQDVKYDYEAPLRLGLVTRANRTFDQ